MKLLQIDSSPLAANSVSRQLTRNLVAQWQAAHPGTTVEYLDLAVDAPTHLNLDSLGFKLGNAPQLTEAQRRENEVSERLVSQFLAADVVVIGAPMYNFSIPSTLKAWIDRIAVAGKTFRYTEKGPEGLAGNKKVIIASGRGGLHTGAPTDFQEPYLRQVFAFLGVTDLEIVRAEGVAYSPQHRSDAIAGALASIGEPVRLAA